MVRFARSSWLIQDEACALQTPHNARSFSQTEVTHELLWYTLPLPYGFAPMGKLSCVRALDSLKMELHRDLSSAD